MLTNTRAERNGKAGGLLPALAFAAAALLAAALPARADSNPANDSDQVVVRIHPLADIGVEIDTANVTLDFTMTMGQTAYTLKPATVTILGTATPIELDVQGANVSVAPVWTLDVDEAPALDEVQVHALFSVARDTAPAPSDFLGTKNLVTTSSTRAGALGGAALNGNFENQMVGTGDMDSMAVGAVRWLWLRLDAPPETSTTSEQDVAVTVTATRTNM